MQKLIRNSALLVAGTFLLMHSLLPHQHETSQEQALQVSEQQYPASIGDLLALALHLDQGEGHLEKFQKPEAQQFNSDIDFAEAFVFESVLPPFEEKQLQTSFAVDFIVPDSHVRHLQFRGPPC